MTKAYRGSVRMLRQGRINTHPVWIRENEAKNEWAPGDIRMFIKDWLSYNPYSQEYIDGLVERVFDELAIRAG